MTAPPTKSAQVAVIIVNYNVRDLLRACLASVFRSGVNAEVHVVDCASSDRSAEMVAAEFPQVHLKALARNVGFARANNKVLRQLLSREEAPDYALLLNPDVELLPGSLAEMVRLAGEHPLAGMIGPRLVKPDGHIDWPCRRGFPTPLTAAYHFSGLARLFPSSPRFARYRMTFLDERATAEVDAISGAFMLVRMAVVRQVGLLDRRFFMYGEDLDWAYRARLAGWRVLYHGRVDAIHHKKASTRQNMRARAEFYRAMRLFHRKHFTAGTPRVVSLTIDAAAGALWALTILRRR